MQSAHFHGRRIAATAFALLSVALFPGNSYADVLRESVGGPRARLQTVQATRAQGAFTVHNGVYGTDLFSVMHPDEVPLVDAKGSMRTLKNSAHAESPTIFRKAIALPSSYHKISVIPGPASLETVQEGIPTYTVDEADQSIDTPLAKIKESERTAGLKKIAIKVPPLKRNLMFELTGKSIAVQRQKVRRNPFLEGDGLPVFDMVNGDMIVSGSCNNVFYTVLLYTHADDYVHDPESYAAREQFLCVGKEYKFSLKEFPDRMRDGTYFLLVGEATEMGAWRPVSDMTEIRIRAPRSL